MLAAGGSGCTGNAFTGGSPESDAGGGDGGDAAPAAFCATTGATHLFCEDFDHDGVPGQFTTEAFTIGTALGPAHIDPNTTTFVSAPQSAAAVAPLLTKAGDEAQAYLMAMINAGTPGSVLKLEFELQIGAGCASNADGATIAILEVGTYAIAVAVASAGAAVAEIAQGPDGGITNQRNYPFGLPAVGSWIDLGLQLNLGTHKLTLTEGTAKVLDGQSLQFAPQGTTGSATIFLGAHVKDVSAVSPGCRVLLDNVLFDIAP
jgi:hypothetical protein